MIRFVLFFLVLLFTSSVILMIFDVQSMLPLVKLRLWEVYPDRGSLFVLYISITDSSNSTKD